MHQFDWSCKIDFCFEKFVAFDHRSYICFLLFFGVVVKNLLIVVIGLRYWLVHTDPCRWLLLTSKTIGMPSAFVKVRQKINSTTSWSIIGFGTPILLTRLLDMALKSVNILIHAKIRICQNLLILIIVAILIHFDVFTHSTCHFV